MRKVEMVGIGLLRSPHYGRNRGWPQKNKENHTKDGVERNKGMCGTHLRWCGEENKVGKMA